MFWLIFALTTLAAAVHAANYSNPIRLNGPDPFIVWDNVTSKYYFTTTTSVDLEITSASTIDLGLSGLRANQDRRLVYQNDQMKLNQTTWAPELHKLDGTWHVYFSLDTHPYVLVGGANPFDPYPGPPIRLSKNWGIDGTVLTLNSTNYFVWSCLRNVTGYNQTYQSLCISELITPTKIDGDNIGIISKPDQPWEVAGFPVNEGPQALYWEGETYLTYSASYCATANYSLGLLHYNGGDPHLNTSWTKTTSGPVFASANGNYGTGHNGIFLSPDGTELWNVFHAVQNPVGVCDSTRATFITPINITNFKTSGPDFGMVGYYGLIFGGPSGEQMEPETINDALPAGCSACWDGGAGGILA